MLHARLEMQNAELLHDIAERQQTAEALRQSEEQFRLIFDSAPIGMVVTTTTGQIVRVNEALCATTGYTADELLGKTIANVTHPDDMANFIGQMVDITERKQAEEQRRAIERKILEAQKLESVGVLAGGIAHDFNNLLTGILGNAEMALTELPPESAARASITQVEVAAQRAAGLTRQMLAYAGRGRFVIEQIDLNRLIMDMAQLLNTSIGKSAHLHYDLAPDLPLIEGDAAQIRQVVMNLIVNAAEAIADQPGSIIVRTDVRRTESVDLRMLSFAPDLAVDDYILLSVTDTGCGMDAATQAKIFEPFFTTKFTGRGLGLAAVQGIVRGHGGALQLTSAIGYGTTFEVWLPLPSSV